MNLLSSLLGRTRSCRGRVLLALGALLASPALAQPVIQSVDLQPNPPQIGKAVTLTVEASGAASVTATIDFRPWAARLLRVTLSAQGKNNGVTTCNI